MSIEINPIEIIERHFAGTPYLVLGKQYPVTLPNELSPWYCYTVDGGHSILSLIEAQFDESDPASWENDLCPCPVKAVMRNYRILNGYPVAPLKYDSTFGLRTEPEDDEF